MKTKIKFDEICVASDAIVLRLKGTAIARWHHPGICSGEVLSIPGLEGAIVANSLPIYSADQEIKPSRKANKERLRNSGRKRAGRVAAGVRKDGSIRAMTDIDLDAIRARDAAHYNGRVDADTADPAAKDRRALLAYVAELREAAGKVTCANCAGSGRVYRHPITVPQICPDCAGLRALLPKESGR